MPNALNNAQPSLAVTQFVMATGLYPSEAVGGGAFTIGMVRLFAGSFDPANDQGARGQTMAIDGNAALFSLIGTTYGGDGTISFGLPDFGGRIVVGTGLGAGLTQRIAGDLFGANQLSLTQSNLPAASGGEGVGMDNSQESAATNYLIRVEGSFLGGPSSTPLAGIVQFAGSIVPDGYLRCEGQTLQIAGNEALFSLIGTTYGGNGTTTFQLPDFRGRAAVGADPGDGVPVGDRSGSATITLTSADFPPLHLEGSTAGDNLYGGGSGDAIWGGRAMTSWSAMTGTTPSSAVMARMFCKVGTEGTIWKAARVPIH